MYQKKGLRVNQNSVLIFLYITSIICGNNLIHYFGPIALPITSFFVIPLDLIIRDILQYKWGKSYKLKIAALIMSGSLVTFLLNIEAYNVALASFCAFSCAGLLDTLIFTRLKNSSFQKRIIVSNLFSTVLDSIVFQTVAFNNVRLDIVSLHCGLKIAGSFFWVFCLNKFLTRIYYGKR